jgi:N-sulfoglucosamine sulfohydrolase
MKTSDLIRLLAMMLTLAGPVPAVVAGERPNLLWITVEDMSPNLGCYGDGFARTPHVDALARQSVRYTHAFATPPVCAPSRVCLITGVHATTLGNPHLRFEITLPGSIEGFPTALRAAGYFATNNAKTDYNLRDEAAFVRATWDRSDERAHWRQRPPGRPFFAVFNLMETHQSRTSVWPEAQFEAQVASRLAPGERADPARAPLPSFYPDTPSARRAMARYYDCIAAMDHRVGEILGDLEADGLADDTIVFFFSDHGMGMPGGKRLLRDAGLRVPLLVRFPPRWKSLAPAPPGATLDRLLSFVDFAPTVLSLAGVPIPPHMPGVAFLGPAAGPGRAFVIGARDRVDEAFDTSRSVREARWLYVRNYRPHLSWAPPEGYSDQSPFRRELLDLARRGRAGDGPTAWLAPTRPREELYDTAADPGQWHNLAADPSHGDTLERLRGRLRAWLIETRDLGFLTEADMLDRCGTLSPREMALRPGKYPFERVLAAAEHVGRPGAAEALRSLLGADDPGIRYWAAVGLHADPTAAAVARDDLERCLRDGSGSVRIEAAGALLATGDHPDALRVLRSEILSADDNLALHALRTLELLGSRPGPLLILLRERLVAVRAREGKEPAALFQRFALEATIRNLESPTP